MNGRRANDEAHKICEAFLGGIKEPYGSHRNIEVVAMDETIAKRIGMNRRIQIWFVLSCCLLIAPVLGAQSSNTQSEKDKAPAQQAPAKKPGSQANPFPEDTSNVPVIPTTAQPAGAPPPAAPAAEGNPNGETTSLLHEDTDPIKSPDDPIAGSSDSGGGFSSSLMGTDDVKIPDEPDKRGKHQKLDEPARQESAQDDENVGAYYLDKKNWKAALSRFESALVLDPENPDVYWGMAEAQRQLGDYARAKANYMKVTEYDPDSKHSKEAKKYLKLPEIANAPAVSVNRPEKSQQ
jgi:tetratricopeptide (TPR) repeat protein